MDLYNPVAGWSIGDILKSNFLMPVEAHAGESDIHSALFNYLQLVFSRFFDIMEQISTASTVFLLSTDAAKLASDLRSIQGALLKFDLIEVSNISDYASLNCPYLGSIRTMSLLAKPLLAQNGVLVSLYMNYVLVMDAYCRIFINDLATCLLVYDRLVNVFVKPLLANYTVSDNPIARSYMENMIRKFRNQDAI